LVKRIGILSQIKKNKEECGRKLIGLKDSGNSDSRSRVWNKEDSEEEGKTK
jgi:hypothetical protein